MPGREFQGIPCGGPECCGLGRLGVSRPCNTDGNNSACVSFLLIDARRSIPVRRKNNLRYIPRLRRDPGQRIPCRCNPWCVWPMLWA